MATYKTIDLFDAPASITLTLGEFNAMFIAFYDARREMANRGWKVCIDDLKKLEEKIKEQINPSYQEGLDQIVAEYRANHPEQYPQEEVA